MATHGVNHFELQTLTDKHKQVASLLAQGAGPEEISALVEYTPQYVSMLTRDPLFKEYLGHMAEINEARLEAIFGKVVETIDEGLSNEHKIEDRLKAARLQLEVTGRIGKNDRPNGALDNSLERLTTLADRLIALQTRVRTGETFNGQVTDVTEIQQLSAA